MTENEFIFNETTRLKKEIKLFPKDFLEIQFEWNEFQIPDSKLVLGEELFGKYEVVDLKGNSVLLTEDFYVAKYLIYTSHYVTGLIKIPNEKSKLLEAVKSYEKYLDTLLKKIESDIKNSLPESKHANKITNQIFNSLNLRRY
ncbi:MAG: hypothetical protein C4539_14630 [Ignavibacteriales bacterium]|nr:MAG: hypothetical protein C4539_14630 [Ignavibacteriales bacterium]